MIKCLKLVLPILLITLFACNNNEKHDLTIEPILMDLDYLEKAKDEISEEDSGLERAYIQLIEDAEEALKEGPFSVTHKEKLPPSRDKHDYASYSRYWWPDPNQPDGLPYTRRDGVTNPKSQSLKESDRQRIGAMGLNTETLSLAYYFGGEEKYARKAAELIRVWFLAPETRMNPNVNHAQCRLGHDLGNKSGVLDGRLLIQALEGSKLIVNSSALSDDEYTRLKVWAGQYFTWLTTNKMALKEAASKNNHGSYYNVQALYFALYAGRDQEAKQIAQNFANSRVTSQINSDGSMPEEIARTRPLFYSMFNLQAMFLVAKLAEKVDVDIWKANDKTSPLRAALDHLAPYADKNKAWPSPTVKEANRMELFPLLLMANHVYPKRNDLNSIEQLPLEKRKTQRYNLALPLMR